MSACRAWQSIEQRQLAEQPARRQIAEQVFGIDVLVVGNLKPDFALLDEIKTVSRIAGSKNTRTCCKGHGFESISQYIPIGRRSPSRISGNCTGVFTAQAVRLRPAIC